MALKDFLQKIFSQKQEDTKKKAEKIKLNELGKFLENKRNNLESREKQVSIRVHLRLQQLILELEKNIKILDSLDINTKRAEEKIKFIVKENLFLYNKYLKKLAESLKKLQELGIIENINSIFADFSKKSHIAFEKATFLIGRELGAVKESISLFFRDLKLILEEDKESLNSLLIVKNLQKKLSETEEIKKAETEIEKQKTEFLKKIEDRKQAIQILENKIKQMKKSQNYLESERKKQEHEKASLELENQIQKLRESIDFKQLASVFHINDKKMRLIKEYQDNFKANLVSDKGTGLLNLVQEAKQQPELEEKIHKILEKQIELANFREKDESSELSAEIKKIEQEIKNHEQEIIKLEKAREKLEENRKNILNDIKPELEKLNIELEES